VGGALYSRFGFRGPFVFGLAVIFLDFIGRIIIIERKDAVLWGVDPAALPGSDAPVSENDNDSNDRTTAGTDKAEKTETDGLPMTSSPVDPAVLTETPTDQAKTKPVALLTVIRKLSKSSRALVAIISTFIYGQAF
jgi:MFS transporter, DHA1 family, solute carrier family 18 (vesicular amine transporter), member 1/2